MSNQGAEEAGGSVGTGLQLLEEAIEDAISALGEARERAERAERDASRKASMVSRLVEGGVSPGELARRVEELEDENKELRRRILKGRASTDRIMASVRFLGERLR